MKPGRLTSYQQIPGKIDRRIPFADVCEEYAPLLVGGQTLRLRLQISDILQPNLDRPALTGYSCSWGSCQGLETVRKKLSWRNCLFLVEAGAADAYRGLTFIT